ncbi:glycosyltransferase family 4 protein [Anaerolineales bacterium HSG24]|nr:glycosyltransferase family 4 protein [Anaerolineales bacterium HSG24]
MKIVLCTHRFLPRFTGGVEIYTLRLAHALQKQEHTVYILTGEPTARKNLTVTVKEDDYKGTSVLRLQYDYEYRSIIHRASYNDPLITAQIRAILQRLQPDIVHATSFSLLMSGTIEATSSLNLPIIYTATDFVLTCRRGIYLKKDNSICTEKEEIARCTACMGPQTQLEKLLTRVWQLTPQRLSHPLLSQIEQLIGKKADFVHATPSIQHRLNYLPALRQKIERIIVPSTYMRDMFVLNGFSPHKVIISPYGVEMPMVNFKKTHSAKLRFGFIGRITFIKGIHLLLEAFIRLPEPDRVQLTIYGSADVKSGQYVQTLQNKATQQSNINFAGFINNENISQLYSQLDILIVPSIWPENSPITILEAQAHNIPIIASDVKGIADLVQHEVNGLIFANQDIDGLTSQITRCLNSPDLVARLSSKSRLIKSIQEDVESVLKVYKEVLATKS